MLEAFELLAVLSAALFSGAAIYISAVEHPARMELDTRAAAMQWAPSYKRATWMQAPLALLSLLGGAAAWLMGAGAAWLAAAVLIGLVIPFTLIVVMPPNHKLLAADGDAGTAETRMLLQRWGKLHAARSALGLASTVLYMWLLRAPQ